MEDRITNRLNKLNTLQSKELKKYIKDSLKTERLNTELQIKNLQQLLKKEKRQKFALIIIILFVIQMSGYATLNEKTFLELMFFFIS